MGEEFSFTDNQAQQRYELHLGALRIGQADYYDSGDGVVIPHTEIEPSYGGRGLGGRLVRFALDDIRRSGRKVVPACPFVGAFIAKNPDYRDLLQ